MSAAELLAQLNAELSAWRALSDTLTQEEAALVAGDADALAALGDAKLKQLEAVSEQARSRLAALQRAGYAPDRAGMESWLGAVGAPELRSRWQALVGLEHETQALNQRIGALIEMRLGATRQALNVLMHAAAGAGAGLYDNDGLAVSGLGGKPLTAA